MSDDRWTSVLVLGGIRSGKSAFAEALVADAPAVRYVATAVGGEDDPEWRARIEEHQRRRPQSWSTEETGADPARLTEMLTEAKPDDTLLVDDLGGWVAALLDPARQPNDDVADVAALAAAVGACPARVVLVSPEVGLSLVPTTPVGRAFADALGSTNQALAEACDRVALVVAGRPVWLKGDPEPAKTEPTKTEPVKTEPLNIAPTNTTATDIAPTNTASGDAGVADAPTVEIATVEIVTVGQTAQAPPEDARPHLVAPSTAGNTPPASPSAAEPGDHGAAEPGDHGAAEPGDHGAAGLLDGPTVALPVLGGSPVFEPGMDLPMPDGDAGPDARDRLLTVDLPGSGLGSLVEAVEFAAATQVTTTPRPWASVRVLLLAGRHTGGAAAGDDPADVERRIAQVENGEGVLSRLAGAAGADIAVLRTAAADPIEDGPTTDAAAVEAALRQGWQLAEAAAEAGRDLLVLASIGVGTDAVATAVTSATTGAEPVAVLPRVLAPGGTYDDAAWMVRCAAVRDALHRIRQEPRGATDILRELGGTDLAVATGALLGAASRRLPVLLDGPVGIAAGLIARDLASQTRHWCLLADAGNLALVRQGADVLGLSPVLELGLGLGEGANALATLPLLRTAVGLAGTVPVHPALSAENGDAPPSENGDVQSAENADALPAEQGDALPAERDDALAGTGDTTPADQTTPAHQTAPADLAVPDHQTSRTGPDDETDPAVPDDKTIATVPDDLTDLIVPNDEDVDLAEPRPDGPGPARTGG